MEQYYDYLKSFPDDRIGEAFTYLAENHKTHYFPLLNDFNEALSLTRKQTFTPTIERRKDIEPYGAYAAEMKKSFKIMDFIRDQVCKPILGNRYFLGKNEVNTSLTWPIMFPFYAEMVRKSLVYSVGTKTWIPITEKSAGGEYWDPAEHGKWE